MTPVQKLSAWAELHGARLVEHPGGPWVRKGFSSSGFAVTIRSPDWAGVSVAPFDDDFGVRWGKKEVHFREGGSPGSIIHELGHVLACRFPPNHRMCIEPRFFGWEWVLSRELGLEEAWRETVLDYGLTNELYRPKSGGMDFSDAIGAGDERLVLDNAVLLGKKHGNINERGEPISVRKSR